MTKSKTYKKNRGYVIGVALILLSIILYGVHEYVLPQYKAYKHTQQSQDQLWLTMFKSLELTREQKTEIKQILQKFDSEKRLSQLSIARHQHALHATINSDNSREEKLEEAHKRIEALFKSMNDLKKSDFSLLREVYFDVLTTKQQAKFLQEHKMVLQPKPVVVDKVKSEVGKVFASLELSSEQKMKADTIMNLPKLSDMTYQLEVTNFQLYTAQFLKDINAEEVNALFAKLLQENLDIYRMHKEQYEKIYTQVLTDKQREGLTRPRGEL